MPRKTVARIDFGNCEFPVKEGYHDREEEHGPFSLSVASCPARSPAGTGEPRVILAGFVVPRDKVLAGQPQLIGSTRLVVYTRVCTRRSG